MIWAISTKAGRTFALILSGSFLALMANPVWAQTPHKSAEQAVRDALNATTSGYYTGSAEKELEPLGDAAAIELIRDFAGRDLAPQEIRGSITVLRMSFAAPKLIVAQADRRPRAALLLLRYSEYQATDTALKQAVADAARSLQNRAQ